jgi:hypothetical protein
MTEADRLVLQLNPYKEVIMTFQAILLWRKPVMLAGLVLLSDAILFWSWLVGAGVFAVFILGCLLTYIGVAAAKRFKLGKRFIVSESESRGLVSFHTLCQKFAESRKKLAMVGDYLLGAQFEPGAFRVVYVLAVWLTLAFVANILGRFWFFISVWNVGLIWPGSMLSGQYREKVD